MNFFKPTFLKIFVSIAFYTPCIVGMFFGYYLYILYALPPYPDIVLFLFITALCLMPTSYVLSCLVVNTHQTLFRNFFTITMLKTILTPILFILMTLFVYAIPISWECGQSASVGSPQIVTNTVHTGGVASRVFMITIKTFNIQNDFVYAFSTCPSSSFLVAGIRFLFGFSSVLFAYFIASSVLSFLREKK